MGWSLGFDNAWNRWIGYAVPAYCDHPKCNAKIDRGLSYVCGDEPWGGEHGCGLYFCEEHHRGHRRGSHGLCPRCEAGKPPYKHPKPEHPRWIRHLLQHKSWAEWRDENPQEVKRLRKQLEAHRKSMPLGPAA